MLFHIIINMYCDVANDITAAPPDELTSNIAFNIDNAQTYSDISRQTITAVRSDTSPHVKSLEVLLGGIATTQR